MLVQQFFTQQNTFHSGLNCRINSMVVLIFYIQSRYIGVVKNPLSIFIFYSILTEKILDISAASSSDHFCPLTPNKCSQFSCSCKKKVCQTRSGSEKPPVVSCMAASPVSSFRLPQLYCAMAKQILHEIKGKLDLSQ